jgi:hypothetical protein
LGEYQPHGATGLHRGDIALLPGAKLNRPNVKAKATKNKPIEDLSDLSQGIWRYRNKWWFWILAILSLGFAIAFGGIYFLYKEFSSSSKPLSDKSRKWLGIVLTILPLPGLTSWIMPVTWYMKTKRRKYLGSALSQLMIFAAYIYVYSISPTSITASGATTTDLPSWVNWFLLVNVAISLWTIKQRPKAEAGAS